MGVVFGNQPCLDPRPVLAFCRRTGLPTDWLGKPNSFSCLAGENCGRGWLLMRLQELNQLNKDTLNALTLLDNSGGQVTVKNLVFVRARCVTPGAQNDPNGAYVVEIADARWLARNPFYANPIDEQYNVRAPAGVKPSATNAYYDKSMNAGVPWTWQQMLDDVWSALNVPDLGLSPILPAAAVPAKNPENFKFIGVPAWRAYNEVLTRLGCVFTPDPLGQGGPTITKIGDADPQLATAEALYQNVRQLDDYYIESNRAKVPATVVVFFHNFSLAAGTEQQTETDTTQWASEPLYSVTTADPTNTPGTQPGSYVALWDDLPVLLTFDGTVQNAADLTARATERTNDYYRMVKTGGGLMRRTYQGILAPNGFLPGLQVSAVAWKDCGAGYFTDVCRLPPPLKVFDDGSIGQELPVNERLRAPDFGRATFPNYPEKVQWVKVGTRTATPYIYNGNVVRIDPNNLLSPTILEACYIVDINNNGLVANSIIKARLNGTTAVAPQSTLPAYVAGDTGASGDFWARLRTKIYANGKFTKYDFVKVIPSDTPTPLGYTDDTSVSTQTLGLYAYHVRSYYPPGGAGGRWVELEDLPANATLGGIIVKMSKGPGNFYLIDSSLSFQFVEKTDIQDAQGDFPGQRMRWRMDTGILEPVPDMNGNPQPIYVRDLNLP